MKIILESFLPTNANDLAYHILKIIDTEEYGIYHCTGKGECTWYEFAKLIIELSGEKCEVRPCSSEEYKTLAKRPEYSSMDNMMFRNTVGDEMRNWEDALKSFISKLDKCKEGVVNEDIFSYWWSWIYRLKFYFIYA